MNDSLGSLAPPAIPTEVHVFAAENGVSDYLSAVIDLSDHYARFDSSISSYNFLRYSERAWALVNSGLHHQNRLRRPDYLAACRAARLDVLWERGWRPKGKELDALRSLQPANRFRHYSFEDLAVQTLRLVARPHQTVS